MKNKSFSVSKSAYRWKEDRKSFCSEVLRIMVDYVVWETLYDLKVKSVQDFENF